MPKRSTHLERAYTAVIGYRPAAGPYPSFVDTFLEDSSQPVQGTSGRLCVTVGEAHPGRRGGPIDALYALAFLGSGDPDAAQQTVIDAVGRLCGHSGTNSTCLRRWWRFLAEQVHLTNESSRDFSGPGRAQFRDAELSLLQQEVVALRLGAASHRRGARLIGVPVSTFGRQLRTALQALASVKPPDPDCTQPARASRCWECPGVRP